MLMMLRVPRSLVSSKRLMCGKLLILAALGGLASSCANVGHDGGLPADLAEILWLPPEAKLEEDAATKPVRIENGRSIYIDGSAAVVFTIESDRLELTSRIVEHVSSLGWHQRRTQYLNPRQATSFYSGWQVHGGGVLVFEVSEALPHDPYRTWHGEWEDDRGNILVYDIGGRGRQFRGLAAYVPRPVVERST